MAANGHSPPAAVQRLVDRLHGRVVAATLTPFDASGRVLHDAVGPYVQALADDGVGGLAVGAHTGRGSRLAETDLVRLVSESAAVSRLPVVAGVGMSGSSTPGRDPSEQLLPLAERLCAAGASALLVVPPTGADRAGVVQLHERLGAQLEVPLFAFVLYDRASGCQYDRATVLDLTAQPWVAGTKLALLDDAVTCQDFVAMLRDRAQPGADHDQGLAELVVTGEDRMFGPSLLWGAESALVGVAAALPALSVRLVNAWTRADYVDFVQASSRLDEFASLTFREPMEGYIQRMAWAAAWQQILPPTAAHDPFAPLLDSAERARLLHDLDCFSSR